MNKDRKLQKNEISRAFKGLGHVFKADKAEMDKANSAVRVLTKSSASSEQEVERLKMQIDELEKTVVRLSPG